MSQRALAAIAVLLLGLCVLAGRKAAEVLGYLDRPQPTAWTFENHTLGYVRGQRVVIRPILEGGRALRYTFLVAVGEPLPDDPVLPLPHLRAGVEEYVDDGWYYRASNPIAALALCQMGALTTQEWLREIRPVREISTAGGGRVLLQATYGHQNGATVVYYQDPERPVPCLGWERSEMFTEGRDPEVYFATDGGRVELTGPK